MRARGTAAVVGLVGVALLASACSGASGDSGRTTTDPTPSAPSVTAAPTPSLDAFYSQRLTWRGCGGGFQCTTLTVPLDYAAPDGRTLGIAVTRLPASGGSAHRLGSLLVNPGGPGASGYDYGRAAQRIVSPAVRRVYDVVGFDPRGIGRSEGLRCQDDPQTDEWVAADQSPDDAAEQARLVQLSRRLGALCQAKDPGLVAHMGSQDAARDMDVLRAALGDQRLTYLGKSYGTFLGATYADLFPSRVGRLVLDGAIDPASTGEQVAAGQAGGFERALRSFARDCLQEQGCPLHGSVDDAVDQVGRVISDADAHPLRGDGGRVATQSLVTYGIAVPLYDSSSWGVLRQALKAALRGDGRLLLALADFYTDRDAKGHYTSGSNDTIYAVSCLDRGSDGTPAALATEAASLAKQYPRFGAFIAWGDLPCTYWPAKAEQAPHPIRAAGAAPILVVGTIRDPATPYAWAQALASELESGALLTWDGDGHTAYRRGSSCVDSAVDGYLLRGVVPKDQRCS